LLQAIIASPALAAHSALVNADLRNELVSVTQLMEELKLRHKLVNFLYIHNSNAILTETLTL